MHKIVMQHYWHWFKSLLQKIQKIFDISVSSQIFNQLVWISNLKEKYPPPCIYWSSLRFTYLNYTEFDNMPKILKRSSKNVFSLVTFISICILASFVGIFVEKYYPRISFWFRETLGQSVNSSWSCRRSSNGCLITS